MSINLGELVLNGDQAAEALAKVDALVKLNQTDVQGLTKLFVENSSAAQNYKNLATQLAAAQKEIKGLTVGTAEFTAAAAKIATLTNQINPVRAALKGMTEDELLLNRQSYAGEVFTHRFGASLGMTSSALLGLSPVLDRAVNGISMMSLSFDRASIRAKTLGTSLLEAIGPEGWVMLGITAAVIGFEAFNKVLGEQTKKAADDAAAALDKLKESFGNMTMAQLESQRTQLEGTKSALETISSQSPSFWRKAFLLFTGRDIQFAEETQGADAAKEAAERVQKQIDAVNAEINTRLKGSVGTVGLLKTQLEDVQKQLEHGNLTVAERNRLLKEQTNLQAQINMLTTTEKPKKDKAISPDTDKSTLSERLGKGMEAQNKTLDEMTKEIMDSYTSGFTEAQVAAGRIKELMAQAADPEEVKKLQAAYDKIWADESKSAMDIRGQRTKETDAYAKGKRKSQRGAAARGRRGHHGCARLGDALVGAFARGNTKANEMLNIINEVAAVALLIAAIETAASPKDIISGIAGVISGLAKFDSGGYTGAGAPSEPAGIVHRGEVVFEKPLVDKHYTDIMGIRAALRNSPLPSGVGQALSRAGFGSGTPSQRGAEGISRGDLMELGNRIDKIAEAIGNMPAPVAQINHPIVLSDAVEKMMPEQMAKYNAKLG